MTGARTRRARPVVIHADESCLGNQNEGLNPGGASALIEVRTARGIERRDLYLSSRETTNNRMALAGAVAVLERLAAKGKRLRVIYISDSRYLVDGMTSWIKGWKARGWRRKGGPIENLDLWQALDRAAANHEVTFVWVRGHAGHPKNEYVDHLAVEAASRQHHSDGVVASGWDAWFSAKRAGGQFSDYDPDEAFAQVARRYGGQGRDDE